MAGPFQISFHSHPTFSFEVSSLDGTEGLSSLYDFRVYGHCSTDLLAASSPFGMMDRATLSLPHGAHVR